MFLFSPDTVIAWAAVAGVCLAILRARLSLVVWLLSPAVCRWICMPLLMALIQPMVSFLAQHWVLLVLLIALSPFVALAMAARLFESFLKLFLGPVAGGRTAGHMFGVWGVRFADWFFRRRRGRPIPDLMDEDER